MGIKQRILISNWTVELFTLAFIVAFVILFKLGDAYNTSITKKFLKGVSATFEKHFFQFGVSPDTLYVKDSAENFSSYATGRIHIAKVNITFKLKPRHNIFVWAMELVLGYFTDSVKVPTDVVDFEITPSHEAKYDNFIAAIASKLEMDDLRKSNYFLSLTKTSDSANLPESFVYMSEVNAFQEGITTVDLKNALTVDAASYVRFIAFTDQPAERPTSLQELVPRRKIIISTNLTTNKNNLKQLSQILEAVFNLIDKLASKDITFKQDALKKVVRTRELEVAKIQKVIDEMKQEELAEEKSKQKKLEREKLKSLSPEEQAKLEKKAMEKSRKKQQKKQRVKM
jgi:hypothetical protein